MRNPRAERDAVVAAVLSAPVDQRQSAARQMRIAFGSDLDCAVLFAMARSVVKGLVGLARDEAAERIAQEPGLSIRFGAESGLMQPGRRTPSGLVAGPPPFTLDV